MMHTLATITGTGAAVVLSSTSLSARQVTVSAGLANTGTVRIAGDLTSSVTVGQQLAAGDAAVFEPSPNVLGDQYNLSGMNVYIPNGDTVIVSYGD